MNTSLFTSFLYTYMYIFHILYAFFLYLQFIKKIYFCFTFLLLYKLLSQTYTIYFTDLNLILSTFDITIAFINIRKTSCFP